MHDLVQQHGEVEHREARHERERQPEVPAVEVDDGHAGRDEHRDVEERDQRVQQRPLRMQPAKLIRRHLGSKVAFELLRVFGVVRHGSAGYNPPRPRN